MYRIKKIIALIGILILLSPSIVGYSETVTINDLIENSIKFNDNYVTIKGEAIGEALERGQNGWININDGTNAIGVWMTKDMMEQVKSYGDYKTKGDTLEIYGKFSRDCREHGGEIDIHADKITITAKGKVDIPTVKSNRLIIASIFTIITIPLAIYFLKDRLKE